jgi:hypothetical protein
MIENVETIASATSSPAFEAIKTWVTYVGVLAVAIVTAYAGVRKALKDLKTGEVVGETKNKIVSATLVETVTMTMWTESNRGVAEAVEELCDKMDSLIHSINYNTEAERKSCENLVELRHHIERLRDKLP